MRTKVDDDFESILDLEPMESKEHKEIVEYQEKSKDELTTEDAIKDFIEVRGNLKDAIENSKQSLEFLLHLARTEESPRIYDSAANLMRALNETNRQLLETHRMVREMQNEEKEGKSKVSTKAKGNNVNTTVFVGSSSEALELLDKINGK